MEVSLIGSQTLRSILQSPWSIRNPNGNNPNEEEILKTVRFVFDFAPTRALRQLSEYGLGLSPCEPNPSGGTTCRRHEFIVALHIDKH